MNDDVGLPTLPFTRKRYMPVREIVARLEALRLSQWRDCGVDTDRIPLAALADFVGCDDSMLRKIALGSVQTSVRLHIALDAAFRLIDARQLRFERHGRQWKPVRSDIPPPNQPSRRCAVVFERGIPKLSLHYEAADTSRKDFTASFDRIRNALTRR